ncbi:MAG: cobalamin biosynthesis protein, partial [Planctomycetes bacterium]|nr:cobalamin biosynthesis protein [Planctomycetota bacterium]
MLSLPWILGLGMALEAAVGWPDWLLRRIGHPVTWIGRMISALEERLNIGSRKRRLVGGAAATGLVVGTTAGIAWLIDGLLPGTPAGDAARIVLVASLLSTRSLYDHVRAVAIPLERGDTAS